MFTLRLRVRVIFCTMTTFNIITCTNSVKQCTVFVTRCSHVLKFIDLKPVGGFWPTRYTHHSELQTTRESCLHFDDYTVSSWIAFTWKMIEWVNVRTISLDSFHLTSPIRNIPYQYRYRSVSICRPQNSIISRPSVVCNVRAPYSAGWNFRQCFYAVWNLGHPLTSTENFTEIVPEKPFRRGRRGGGWGAKVKDKMGIQN